MDTFKSLFSILLISILFIPATFLSQNIPLAIGVRTQMTQAKSTTVRYEINFPEPCEININVIGWQNTLNWGTDYDRVYVYNSNGDPIGRNDQSLESDQFLFHMLSDTANLKTRVGMEGTYYIDFHSGTDWGWPAGKENQSYSVLVTVTSVLDTNETNDSMGSAKGIILGEMYHAHQWKRVALNSVWGDEDWYRIDLSSGGILTLEVKNWTPTLNWGADYDRFYIYNNNGEAIGVQSSNQEDPYFTWMLDTDTETITINLANGGTYYMRFHSGAGYNTEEYTLMADFVPVIDQFEPNDELAQAKEIQFGTWYNAYQWRSLDFTTHVTGDEDYYNLSIPSDGELVITLNDWIGTYNWGADFDRMYIYNINGDPVNPGAGDPYLDWMMGGGNITKRNLTAGEYYVRLHSGAGFSNDPYKILFEFNPSATDIEEDKITELPVEYNLYQNYPNPFNPSTKIKYDVKEAGNVSLIIYDILGNEISTLINNEFKAAGNYEVKFDAAKLASGIYIYRYYINDFIQIKKMLLMK